MRSVPAAALLAMVLAGCSQGAPPSPAASTTADGTAADRAPSALVTTVLPRRGTLPATIGAYGSVAPSQTGTQSISVAQPGEIAALLVTTGSVVRQGQPLLRFVTAPSARAAYRQAADALAAARAQRASAAALLAQKLATRDQLVLADKAVADASSALAALAADGAGIGTRTLAAPFSGVVTAVAVATGDRPAAGAPLLTVARSGAMVVTVGVEPWQRAGLRVGAPASLKRLSGGPQLSARVARIDGALNPVTRLIDVDLAFAADALVPGESLEAAIETGQVAGWVVPHNAVVTADGAAHVFQAVGGKAHAVPVRVLLTGVDADVVAGPVDPRHGLIVAGAYQVADGDPVRKAS